jgi:hypothetical protein
MLPSMDADLVDPDRPGLDLDLKLLREDFGHLWEIHYLERAVGEPSWLAYHREKPAMPAVTADSADQLRDFLNVLTPAPRLRPGHITK